MGNCAAIDGQASALPAVSHLMYILYLVHACIIAQVCCHASRLHHQVDAVLDVLRSRRSITGACSVQFIARDPGVVPNSRGVEVLVVGAGQAETSSCDPSLTCNQTPELPFLQSTSCTLPTFHLATEPPCEALIVGPPLLNPVIVVF